MYCHTPPRTQVGDVLLTYENEVILTNAVYGEKALPYVVPRVNVRIECPISMVDKVRRCAEAGLIQARKERQVLRSMAASGGWANRLHNSGAAYRACR